MTQTTAGPPIDPAFCPGCGTPLLPGFMVCNSCGMTILRSSYPMSGDWNRQLVGVAVSGWGWSFETGMHVNLIYGPRGIDVQAHGLASVALDWQSIAAMTVHGPETTSGQSLGLLTLIDPTDIEGSAINLGISYLLNRSSTQVTSHAFFSMVGDDMELVVYAEGVNYAALRWQLAPAFATWRGASSRGNGGAHAAGMPTDGGPPRFPPSVQGVIL